MAVSLTKDAGTQIKSALVDRGRGIGIRIGVETVGCSGLSYRMEFVDNVEQTDEIFSLNECDFSVVIDKKSLVYLDGIELDYKQEGINQGFVFNNPNAKGTCGCGESFTI